MSNQANSTASIMRTTNGSIDYTYYDSRARNIRGDTIYFIVKKLFKNKGINA